MIYNIIYRDNNYWMSRMCPICGVASPILYSYPIQYKDIIFSTFGNYRSNLFCFSCANCNTAFVDFIDFDKNYKDSYDKNVAHKLFYITALYTTKLMGFFTDYTHTI
jgi:hypothetical protein